MKTKTELDQDFEYKDSKQLGKEMIIFWGSGFLLGAFIATFLIMLIMSIVKP